MRPIDADAMDVEKIYCYYSDHCRSEDVQEWVDEQPTLDYEPVRYGRWVKYNTDETWGFEDDTYWYACSECGEDAAGRVYEDDWYSSPIMSNYCPNCGARMDGEAMSE